MSICPAPHMDPSHTIRLAQRRSTAIPNLTAPGPDADQITQLLTLAIRTPDHGKLTPWRFMIFTQEGRARAGAAFAARHRVLHPDADPSLSEVEHARFSRVPLVVGVVFSPKDSPKVPQWEQQLSAGAVCMNLLHAADSMGFGAKWLSEWIAYDRPVLTALGLEAHEQIAGYIYIGTQTAPEMDRPRPDIAQLSRWF